MSNLPATVRPFGWSPAAPELSDGIIDRVVDSVSGGHSANVGFVEVRAGGLCIAEGAGPVVGRRRLQDALIDGGNSRRRHDGHSPTFASMLQRIGPAMTCRLQRGTRLVVASHNAGKVREIRDLVAPHGLTVVSAAELGLAEPEETGSTFAANAELKALAAARAAGLPALSDDSGLEVEALGGAPGIYSARWAGPTKDFSTAMRRVAEEVRGRGAWVEPGPRANFICALCLAWPDGSSELFEGKVYGHLVWPPRGSNGFGYDPMFVADGEALTFGEMQPDAKHAMSHRARAFQLFAQACLGGEASG